MAGLVRESESESNLGKVWWIDGALYLETGEIPLNYTYGLLEGRDAERADLYVVHVSRGPGEGGGVANTNIICHVFKFSATVNVNILLLVMFAVWDGGNWQLAISARRLVFLKTTLKHDKNILIRQVYEAQKKELKQGHLIKLPKKMPWWLTIS